MSRLLVGRIAGMAALLCFLSLAAAARADYTEEQLQADLKMLADAKVPHGDSDLLDFFKKRLLSEDTRQRLDALIEKLSSKSFKERTQASADIIKEGPPALPVLRTVVESKGELELKSRAEECIKQIEKKSPTSHVIAAARILKFRRTEGAGAVLMEYVAVAPDSIVEEEIFGSLYSLAMLGAKIDVLPPVAKAGTLDPMMVRALSDKEPSRRAIAALVVGRYGDAQQRGAVAKLLDDKEPAVRFRAAQGLACGRDAAGVPVLLELLEKGPMPLALQAEDILSLIAEEKGPAAPLGEKADLRTKCYNAWKQWYDENKSKIDLAKFDADSAFGGINERVSKGAMAFIKAILKFDIDMIRKVTDVPFTFVGQFNFNTREEFDNFINMLKNQGRQEQEPKFTLGKVVPGSEYARGAQDSERTFLEAARIAQVYAVFITIEEGGPRQALPFFIRLSGGRARCIGIGVPKINMDK